MHRTARATTRKQPAERHARWHGNAQRIGGHHGRVSSQTGCATPITADALTGPKYRLSNDAGLVTLNRNSSPGSRRRQSCKDGSGRPSRSAGSGGRRHAVDAYLTGDDAHVLRRDRAHTFEQRNARRQVAALRSQRGGPGGSGTSTMLSTDNGRGSEAVRGSNGSTRYQPTATLSDGL
jgi:hypothetical protein